MAETIRNERDEPTPPAVVYDLPPIEEDVDLDFIRADDLTTIERGISSVQRTSDVMALVQGLGIVKIESEALWRQADYPNLRAYRIDQAERLGMSSPSISERRKMAENYLRFRKLLGKTALKGNVSKLVYFDQAIERHGDPKVVLETFRRASFREFRTWARPPRERDELPSVDASIRGGELSIDGHPTLSLSDDLPEEERGFLVALLRAAYRARKGNLLPHVVACYDSGEARAVENFIKRYRASK